MPVTVISSCFSFSQGHLFNWQTDRLHPLSSWPGLSKNRHKSNCYMSSRHIFSWITNSMLSFSIILLLHSALLPLLFLLCLITHYVF